MNDNLHLIDCLKKAYDLDSDSQLSRQFNLSISAVAMWRRRGQCPLWVEYLCAALGGSPEHADPLAGLDSDSRALVEALVAVLRRRG